MPPRKTRSKPTTLAGTLEETLGVKPGRSQRHLLPLLVEPRRQVSMESGLELSQTSPAPARVLSTRWSSQNLERLEAKQMTKQSTRKTWVTKTLVDQVLPHPSQGKRSQRCQFSLEDSTSAQAPLPKTS